MHHSRHIKIAVTGINSDHLSDLLKTHYFDTIKISKHFELIVHQDVPVENCCDYHYIFYSTNMTHLSEDSTMNDLSYLGKNMTSHHLFIVIDGCHQLEIDDDDEPVFKSNKQNKIYQNIIDKIDEVVNDELYHSFLISSELIEIWKIILNEKTVVNLSDDQMSVLADNLSVDSNKKDIKMKLKKTDKNNKLKEAGYIDMYDVLKRYLKIIKQKKLVYQNYLCDVSNTELSDSESLKKIIEEIENTTFFNEEMYASLQESVKDILMKKTNKFISDNPKDEFYYQILNNLSSIYSTHQLDEINNLVDHELDIYRKELLSKQLEEIVEISNLRSIYNYLENSNDKIGLFNNIKNHTNIFKNNIDRMDQWVEFLKKCQENSIISEQMQLIEDILVHKINYYADISNLKKDDIHMIYLQVLHTFVIRHLDKHFIFTKLFMHISHLIRYSGRNITEHINRLTKEKYQEMLLLENYLLDLLDTDCSSSDR